MTTSILANLVELHEEAERILWETAFGPSGEDTKPVFTFDGQQIALFRALGWSDLTIQSEHRRAQLAKRLLGEAVGAKELSRLRKDAERAATLRDKECPRIAEQIEKLQQQAEALRADAAAQAARVEQVEGTRTALKNPNLLPPQLRIDRTRLAYQSTAEHEAATATKRDRLAQINHLLTLDHTNRRAVAHAEDLPEGHPAKATPTPNGQAYSVPAAAWRDYQADLAAERERLLADLETSGLTHKQAQKRLDAIGNHYLSQLDK